MNSNTLIVNLIGGPSSGKSTMAAGLFYELKRLGHSAELVTEFAKELTWENRTGALHCQAYIFGKQFHRIDRLVGKVDIVITDTSSLLNPIYQPDNYPPSFEQCVVDMYRLQNNMTINVERMHHFISEGRNEDESASINIDNRLIELMAKHDLPYTSVTGDEDGLRIALETIIGMLNVH